MYAVLIKMFNFILTHRFSLEIAGIASVGLTAELIVTNMVLKILVTGFTLFFVIRTGYKNWNK